MTKIIWKFQLQVADFQLIPMPKDAEILTVQMQFDKSCIWALVDPTAEYTQRHICIHGTGNEIHHEHKRYIGTFQIDGGNLVFHVFELGANDE